MRRVSLLLLLAVASTRGTGEGIDNEHLDATSRPTRNVEGSRGLKQDPAPQNVNAMDLEEIHKRDQKILAFYTTNTQAVVVTSTVYSLSTCLSTTNTPACTGRRKRNILSEQLEPAMEKKYAGTS